MQSFNVISGISYADETLKKIKQEIEGKSKEYLLGIDENEYYRYLFDKYHLEPLKIDLNNEGIDKPRTSKERIDGRQYGSSYQVDVYEFTLSYTFEGSPVLFQIRPNAWIMTSHDILIDERRNLVSLNFKLYNQDAEKFQHEKKQALNGAFANVENANNFAHSWNTQAGSFIQQTIANRKNFLQKENDFFAAIKIPVDQNTQTIFTAPSIKKKDIPQPVLSRDREFSSEPVLSKEMYEDVVKIIYDSGKSMERKPSLYIDKDEEAIRDQFLFILETRYDSITATGETFNRGGKTDIIIKYAKDGSNLFVAECKFWSGRKMFLDTITQLFDRYLTWRDSKVAVIIFVKNEDFTNVLNTIKSEVVNHPYYIKANNHRGESSFNYQFHLKQDHNKMVQLAIMAFHYDKT